MTVQFRGQTPPISVNNGFMPNAQYEQAAYNNQQAQVASRDSSIYAVPSGGLGTVTPPGCGTSLNFKA